MYCNVIVIDTTVEKKVWGLEWVMVQLWMDGTWAVGCTVVVMCDTSIVEILSGAAAGRDTWK